MTGAGTDCSNVPDGTSTGKEKPESGGKAMGEETTGMEMETNLIMPPFGSSGRLPDLINVNRTQAFAVIICYLIKKVFDYGCE